jgi:hypothetical protein
MASGHRRKYRSSDADERPSKPRKKPSKPTTEAELARIYETMPIMEVMHGKGQVKEIFDSHTEEMYFTQLADDKRAGRIREFWFKPCRLKLAPGMYYEPDALVLGNDDQLTFHEIKGAKYVKATGECLPYSRPLGMAKFKMAAAILPFAFTMVWWDKSNKTWLTREMS